MNNDSLGILRKFCSAGFTINKAAINPEDRTIEGYFTDDKIDLYGHVVTKQATESATPDYATWGNVRVQHDKPIGTVVEIGKKAWNHIKVRIVNDEVWKDALGGIYKGFSIGAYVLDIEFKDVEDFKEDMWEGVPSGIAKAIKQMGEILVIKAIDIVEVSLVDRPANPRAVLMQAGMMTAKDTVIQKQLDDYYNRLIKITEENMSDITQTDVVEDAEIVEDVIENEAEVSSDEGVEDVDVLELMVDVLSDMSETLSEIQNGVNGLYEKFDKQAESIENLENKLTVKVQQRKAAVSDEAASDESEDSEGSDVVATLSNIRNLMLARKGVAVRGEVS